MSEYRRVDSFERDGVDAVAVGPDVVGVASGRTVEVISGSDRSQFDHDEAIVDLAIGDRIVVLSEYHLVAYSRGGDRLWKHSRPDAHALATVAGGGTIGVLEPDHVRLLAEDSGRERATVERPRSGRAADDELIATDDGFVVATWSFLTGLTADGSIRFDENFDTVIRSIGYAGDSLVVAFQNQVLAGLDSETATMEWETELPVSHVAPVGQDRTLVTTDDGIRTISPTGAIDSVDGIDTGHVFEPVDGSVVCSIRSGTVSTHLSVENQLDVDVITEEVGVGGAIEVTVRNGTESSRRTTLGATLEGGSLSPSERSIELDPEEAVILDFPVASVEAEGRSSFEMAADDRTLANTVVALRDAADSTVSVNATVQPTEIIDGTVTLDVTVENVGDVGLDSVSLFETADEVTDIEPGESWRTSVTRPFEPGRTVTIGLEAIRGPRRSEFAPTCTLPAEPSIELSADGEALSARIDVPGDVDVSDELVVEVPGFGRIRTAVDIEDDLLLIVPIYEGGTARIRLTHLDVAERIRVSGRGPLVDSSSIGSQRRRPSSEQATSRSSDRTNRRTPDQENSHSPDQASSEPADQASRRSPDPANQEPADQDTRQPSAQRNAARDATRAAGSPEEEPTRTADGVPESLEASRSLSTDELQLGRITTDRIQLRPADRDIENIALVSGDERIEVGALESNASVEFERDVAILSPDGASVSPVDVVSDESTVAELPGERLAVADDGIHSQIAVDPGDGTVRGRLQNDTADVVHLRGVSVGEYSLTPEPNVRLPPGEWIDVSGRIRQTPSTDLDAVETSLSIERADGDTETIRSAAAVFSFDTASGSEAPVTVSIGEATEVAGDYGTVIFVVENDGDRPLGDVDVTAEGDAINQMLYSGAHRESLPPGGRIEHFIDLKTTSDDATLDVSVTYEESGAETIVRYRASGPTVTDERDWTDEHRDAWSIENADDDVLDGVEFPPLLTTKFRSSERRR